MWTNGDSTTTAACARRAHRWRLLSGLSLASVLFTGLLMLPADAGPGGGASQGEGPRVEEPGSRGQAKGRGNGKGPKHPTTSTTTVRESLPPIAPPDTQPVVSTTIPAPPAPTIPAPPAPIATPPPAPVAIVEVMVEPDGTPPAPDHPEVDPAPGTLPTVGIRSHLIPERGFDRAPIETASQAIVRRGPSVLAWNSELAVFAGSEQTRELTSGMAVRAVPNSPRLLFVLAVAIFGCVAGLATFPKNSDALLLSGRYRRARRFG